MGTIAAVCNSDRALRLGRAVSSSCKHDLSCQRAAAL